MYLPSDALIAVLPLPNRSYAAPRRGLRSCQLGTLSTLAKCNSGTKSPAGRVDSGTQPWKSSYRTPRFMVNRFTVHWSCAKNPISRCRVGAKLGDAYWVSDVGMPFRRL